MNNLKITANLSEKEKNEIMSVYHLCNATDSEHYDFSFDDDARYYLYYNNNSMISVVSLIPYEEGYCLYGFVHPNFRRKHIMTNLISELGIRVSNFDITNINKVIDTLYLVKSNAWDTVSAAFSSSTDVVKAISDYSGSIIRMNSLPGGLSVSDAPVQFKNGIRGIFPGAVIPVLAWLTQWWNMKINSRGQQIDTSTQMGSTMNTIINLR